MSIIHPLLPLSPQHRFRRPGCVNAGCETANLTLLTGDLGRKTPSNAQRKIFRITPSNLSRNVEQNIPRIAPCEISHSAPCRISRIPSCKISGNDAPRIARRRAARGYTLIEVLVVAVIVVLMLGMALPVFRAITGNRSEAGASNIIAAALGRSRTDALGLQKPYGVAIIYNPSLQQTYLAEVNFPPLQIWTSDAPTHNLFVPQQGYISVFIGGLVYYYINDGSVVAADGSRTLQINSVPPTAATYKPLSGLQEVGGPPLELSPDTDVTALPVGVGVQTVCNCNFNSGVRSSDGYLSFGVLLFDGKGKLNAYNYGVSGVSKLCSAAGLSNNYPAVVSPPILTGSTLGVPSQFGLVIFQRDAYLNQRAQIPNQTPAFAYSDALYMDSTPTNQSSALSDYTNGTPTAQQEENWLDLNATPLLIDRYTGTLIRHD